jgi:hypothetical protein
LFGEGRPYAAPVRHHEDEGRGKGVDQFKIGPVVGTGVPSIISFGGTIKLTRFLGAGVNVGLIPKMQLNYYGKATLSYQHYDVYGRLYPFGGGFFLGAGAGYATVDGTVTRAFALAAPVGNVRYDSAATVRTLMLTALVGYFYTTSIGFSFGLDAGAQIPIAPSQISDSSSLNGDIPAALRATAEEQYLRPTQQSVRETLERIGRTTLPTVNLRIGWIL